MADPRSTEALDVAERHAKGLETDQELGAAADVARAAMREKQATKLRQILDAGKWVDGGGQ
jgi:hypothetical protein